MVAGNMGTEWKMNYTVIGDTVNLSARLEAANKQYGTQIMINDKTYEQAKNIIVAHKMDNIAVKGKKKGSNFERMKEKKKEKKQKNKKMK